MTVQLRLDELFHRVHQGSSMDTLGVGTRNTIPVNLPFNDGITFPTALAVPVLEGIIL